MIGMVPATVGGTQAQFLDHLGGSVHAQIRQDQRFFQLIVKIVIDGLEAGKYLAQRIAQRGAGFGKTRLDFIKKSHF